MPSVTQGQSSLCNSIERRFSQVISIPQVNLYAVSAVALQARERPDVLQSNQAESEQAHANGFRRALDGGRTAP